MISPQSTRAYLICSLLQEYSDRYTAFDADSLSRGARCCQSWSWPFRRFGGEGGWLHTAPTQKRLLHGCSLYQTHEAHCPPLQPGKIKIPGRWSLLACYTISSCWVPYVFPHICSLFFSPSLVLVSVSLHKAECWTQALATTLRKTWKMDSFPGAGLSVQST